MRLSYKKPPSLWEGGDTGSTETPLTTTLCHTCSGVAASSSSSGGRHAANCFVQHVINNTSSFAHCQIDGDWV